MSGDIFGLNCEVCDRRFFSSGVYRDHMRHEHPDEPLAIMVYKPDNYKPRYKKKERRLSL